MEPGVGGQQDPPAGCPDAGSALHHDMGEHPEECHPKFSGGRVAGGSQEKLRSIMANAYGRKPGDTIEYQGGGGLVGSTSRGRREGNGKLRHAQVGPL